MLTALANIIERKPDHLFGEPVPSIAQGGHRVGKDQHVTVIEILGERRNLAIDRQFIAVGRCVVSQREDRRSVVAWHSSEPTCLLLCAAVRQRDPQPRDVPAATANGGYDPLMDRYVVGRIWFGLTALAALSGLIIQLFSSYDTTTGFFDEPWDRVWNTFAFFTIQSNIFVAAACALLAAGVSSRATWFRTLRLLSTLAIALTFVVFYAVLRDDNDLSGKAAVADFLLHTVSPIMCVSGWLLFGPRRLVDRTAIALTVVYLLLWGTFTLIRGEVVGFYPYPFINPDIHSYGRVSVNLVIVAAVFVAFGVGALRLDARLADRRGDDPSDAESGRPTAAG